MSDAIPPPPEPPLPEPLRTALSSYFDVELFWHGFPADLKAFLAADPARAALFKAQFAEAITQGTLSLAGYRKLTNHAFGNVGELYAWLFRLWAEIYGDEPIPGDE